MSKGKKTRTFRIFCIESDRSSHILSTVSALVDRSSEEQHSQISGAVSGDFHIIIYRGLRFACGIYVDLFSIGVIAAKPCEQRKR